MEFDVLAVLPALEGEDIETAAQGLLAGFVAFRPSSGPVASVDLALGTFDISFTVEASDVYEAIDIARSTLARGARAAGLEARALDAFHVDAAAGDREAVPA